MLLLPCLELRPEWSGVALHRARSGAIWCRRAPCHARSRSTRCPEWSRYKPYPERSKLCPEPQGPAPHHSSDRTLCANVLYVVSQGQRILPTGVLGVKVVVAVIQNELIHYFIKKKSLLMFLIVLSAIEVLGVVLLVVRYPAMPTMTLGYKYVS